MPPHRCSDFLPGLATRPLGLALAIALVTVSGVARAGGLFVTEMGTPDLATAAAGRAATAETAATAFGNPAGMARLKDSQLLIGVQGGYGVAQFDRGSGTTVSGGNGGNALGAFPGGGLYAVYSLTPDFKIGLSAGSNFGGDLEYEQSWSGRYYGTRSTLMTFGAWPVASYKINEWLSIGGGAQIIYGSMNVKTSVASPLGGPDGQIQLDSDDVGFGGIAGLLVEPRPGTRIGITYTSPVDLKFKQKPDTAGGGPVFDALDPRITDAKVDLGLTIPQSVMLSAHHDLTPDIAIMGNVTWQNWSQFGQPSLEVTSTTSRSATTDLGYKDTWGFAVGGRWRFLPKWSCSAGFAYDTSPMSKSERTPALPLDRQFRIGTGIQYALSERITLGAAYEYLNLGEGDINVDRGPLAGSLQGNYATNEVHFVNATLAWTF